MGYKVHFPALSFQRVDPENPLIAVGEPVLIKKGGDVPEWAQPATISALANAGMILPVAEKAPEPDEPVAPAMANPEVPVQFGGPATLETVTGTGAESLSGPSVPATTGETPAPQPETVERPDTRATKPEWEAYAEAIGIPRNEAEALTKSALMDRVAQREAEIAK